MKICIPSPCTHLGMHIYVNILLAQDGSRQTHQHNGDWQDVASMPTSDCMWWQGSSEFEEVLIKHIVVEQSALLASYSKTQVLEQLLLWTKLSKTSRVGRGTRRHKSWSSCCSGPSCPKMRHLQWLTPLGDAWGEVRQDSGKSRTSPHPPPKARGSLTPSDSPKLSSIFFFFKNDIVHFLKNPKDPSVLKIVRRPNPYYFATAVVFTIRTVFFSPTKQTSKALLNTLRSVLLLP